MLSRHHLNILFFSSTLILVRKWKSDTKGKKLVDAKRRRFVELLAGQKFIDQDQAYFPWRRSHKL